MIFKATFLTYSFWFFYKSASVTCNGAKKTSFESIYYSYFNLLFVFILSSFYLLRDTRLVYYTLQRGVFVLCFSSVSGVHGRKISVCIMFSFSLIFFWKILKTMWIKYCYSTWFKHSGIPSDFLFVSLIWLKFVYKF